MPLPPCHSRRDLEGETNLFYCAHPRMHVADQRVTAEICQICPYWSEPAPEAFRPFPPPPPRGECRCLGEQTGLRDCPTCMGHVRVKVFACAHPVHGETTLAECLTCPDHEEREPANCGLRISDCGLDAEASAPPPVRSYPLLTSDF